MAMQFEHNQDYKIGYNFDINYNHSKHHLHNKNNCTCSPNSSGTIIDRKLIGTSEKHNWSSGPPKIMTHNFLKVL